MWDRASVETGKARTTETAISRAAGVDAARQLMIPNGSQQLQEIFLYALHEGTMDMTGGAVF